MANVIQVLLESDPSCQVIVFAHNSHVVDFRATDRASEVSLGQICMERELGAYIILQSTFCGKVRAAKEWGAADEEFDLETASSSSLSFLLHSVDLKDFVLDLDSELEVRRLFQKPMASRAIGVVYKESQENLSHYFECIHASASHAIIHIDRTTALKK
jgi:erythromycin esterase